MSGGELQSQNIVDRDSMIKEVIAPIARTIAETRLAEAKAKGGMLLPDKAYQSQQEGLVIDAIQEQFMNLEKHSALVRGMLAEYTYLLPADQKESIPKEIENAFSNVYVKIGAHRTETEVQTLQELLGITDEMILWIYQVGRYCLETQKYTEAFSFFSLLTMLDNFVADYWLGLGISQKKTKQEREGS